MHKMNAFWGCLSVRLSSYTSLLWIVKLDYQNMPNLCFMKLLDTNPSLVICFLLSMHWDRLYPFPYTRTDICHVPLCVLSYYRPQTAFGNCAATQWIGDLINSGKNIDSKIFYTYSPMGKRERGRPMKRWRDQFREIAVGVGTHQSVKSLKLLLIMTMNRFWYRVFLE
jgi:hypothetical protein